MDLTLTVTDHTESLQGSDKVHNVRLTATLDDGAIASLHLSGLSDAAFKGLDLGSTWALGPKPARPAAPVPAAPKV